MGKGNIVMAELVFPPRCRPPAMTPTTWNRSRTATRSQDDLIATNRSSSGKRISRVTLDPKTGAVASLLHKASGRETIDERRAPFRISTGRRIRISPGVPSRPPDTTPPPRKARLDWFAKGPLFATVRAHHRWKYLNFETRVTLWPAGRTWRSSAACLRKSRRFSGRHRAPYGYEFGLLAVVRAGFRDLEGRARLSAGGRSDREKRLPRPDVRRSTGKRRGPAGASSRHAMVRSATRKGPWGT